MQLSELIRERTKIPVIWGGIHASSMVDEALQFADMVCVGEGELTLLEVMQRLDNKEPLTGIAGLCLRSPDGKTERNPLRPLIPDISVLPFYDYSNENHYILNRASKRIEPLNDKLLAEAMPVMPKKDGGLAKIYRTITDRGCPHRCSYCNVPFLKNLYSDDPTPFLRARNPENVILEFEERVRQFPFIEGIHIIDDTFFSRSTTYLQAFSRLYRERINLPLYVQASPNTLTEKKLTLLLDAGAVYLEMGLQTGSDPIRKMYHRPENDETILQAGKLVHRYRKQLIAPDYHVILDNPWETSQDTLQTARLLARLPRPFGLAMSSLLFFPGTELFSRARKEGLIKDIMRDVYLKPFFVPPRQNFANFMIYLNTFNHFPRPLLRLMLRPAIADKLVEKRLGPLLSLGYTAGELIRFFTKGICVLIRFDTTRMNNFFKRVMIRDYQMVQGRKGK